MKKFLLKTSVVFIITIGIFSLSSCKDKYTDSENDSEEEVSTEEELIPVHEYDCDGVDQKVSSEIKITYWNYINEKYYDGKIHKQPEDLYIEKYAELKNSHSFTIGGDGIPYNDAEYPMAVAGYVITLGSSQPIYIFNNGKLYLVEEAYEKGIIDKEDVYEIGKVFDSTFADR